MPAPAKKNPATPTSRAPQAIDSNRIVIGWYRSLTFNEGREPILAEAASKIPSPHPTHQVASIPHSKPRRVGEVSGSIIGCATPEILDADSSGDLVVNDPINHGGNNTKQPYFYEFHKSPVYAAG
jgi:hypothetical protein